MSDILARLTAALADRYRLAHELGAGGMATVYLAEDLKHHRRVAVKVLHPELAAVLGAERFLAEIRTTANLQHPHILPLHDSGQADGLLFYVMPYVEGETLRARLEREQQLPVEEAVRITREVASALDYAHRHGVIHRDIKPENILLHEGQALIADFGIALAVSSAGGPRMTQTGMSLGTPEYMSPEQALGERTITAKSDVYALGCVLYEMLTGEPPFTGATVQAILAKVATEQPTPPRVVRQTVPLHLEAAALKALAKLPADRYGTAAEFSEALGGKGTVATLAAAVPAPATIRAWDRRSRALLGTTVLLGAALGLSLLRDEGAGRRAHDLYDVGLPDSAPISFSGGSPWGEGWTALTVSPAADFVVYVAERNAGTELWYRSLVDTVARPIPGTAGAYHPMLSPDGKSVAYFAGNQLLVAPLAGGAPVALAELDRPHGGQWAGPGQLLVADSNGSVVRSFDPAARSSAVVVRGRCAIPRVFGADALICSSRAAFVHPLGALELGDSTARPLRMGAADSATGGLLFGSQFTPVDGSAMIFLTPDGSLAGAMVDDRGLRVGRPVPLVGGVRREGFDTPGQFALASSGTLVYAPGENAEVGRFARVSEGRAPEELPIPPAAHHRFDLTPDGRRLVSALYGLAGMELWVYDVLTGRGERLMSAPFIGEPRWDPRGERLLVLVTPRVGEPSVTVLIVPGSSTPPDTVLGAASAVNVFSFEADSTVLGVLMPEPEHPVRVDLRTKPPRLDPITPFAYFGPELSPDRHWLAYSSSSSGRWEAFVERFPADGQRFKISPTGGLEPQWYGTSDVLFRSGSTWYTVRIDPTASRPVGEPRPAFTDPRFIDTMGRSNVVAPDGSVVYLRGTRQATGSFLRVIPAFTDQLRSRVRAAR